MLKFVDLPRNTPLKTSIDSRKKNFNEIHSLIHSKEYHGKNIVGKLN